MSPIPDRTIPRFLLLLFGVLCIATAVIMIKASTEQPILVASYRLLVAALVLSPFFWRDLRSFEGKYGWKQISWTILPAVALAVAFHQLGGWGAHDPGGECQFDHQSDPGGDALLCVDLFTKNESPAWKPLARV